MTDSQSEVWNQVRQYYYERFGTAPELVDIAPVLDILRLCASGSSNKSIAEFLGETEMGIAEIIDAYLGFMGWEKDLIFSPLSLYKELERPNWIEFVDVLIHRYGYDKIHSDFDFMYNSARMVEKLERLFDEKWI